MYRALAGTDAAEQAWHLAQDIPAERIDDGNSLTYVLAWIAEHLV
jgi:hypothetical protein